MLQPVKISDFNAIRLTVASPAMIKEWSFGEITKPETINYRTQKPEKGGLFAEEIFGPTKDWECYCGKYKKIRYKGIVCDKCGVEVTRSAVRRERFGHIELAAPVSHIWFLRGVPSRLGLVLNMSVQNMERVIYFADFIITRVDDDLKKQTLEQVEAEYQTKKKMIINEFEQKMQRVASGSSEGAETKELKDLKEARTQKLKDLENAFKTAEKEIAELIPMRILAENVYHDLSIKYGHLFEVGIGAEAIKEILDNFDLDRAIDELETLLGETGTEAKREKMSRRLKLLKSLRRNDIKPSWMIMTTIPVIPPELRPMVPLDGGRFATSDLNDLYRRVINRNNRLKQLLELNTPEVISRNEKRMLQEAVDALIDNSARHGKTVVASTGQKRNLKSLADILKGKQGRFRQNLLGKRVDYSGRSVIVVGPHLRIDQCGLPKKMALELFKPFIMSELIKKEIVHNVRSAGRYIEAGHEEVWDTLEAITSKSYVLLNRAPTLHRLSIQAFKPILIEGLAIQLHPMVCSAFNADFDGDQMAVHVPLTAEAQAEAANIMLSTENLIKPATGEPIATPNQDIVWGIYYLTKMLGAVTDETKVKHFSGVSEAMLAYQSKTVNLHEPVKVRLQSNDKVLPAVDEQGRLLTTVGRLIFNRVLPTKIPFQNELIDKKKIGRIIRECFDFYDNQTVGRLLDSLKDLSFEYLTRSGLSWGMGDLPHLEEKNRLVAEAEKQVEEAHSQYEMGLLTASERHAKIIEIWTEVKDKVVEVSKNGLDLDGSVFSMIDSGARGSWGQLTQIVGMKGLVTNPVGDIIELPVKGNFKEGFDVLEYFISTHGARKGLSDTALRTANAGYLTRRLVDVAQDLVIKGEDCGDDEGYVLYQADSSKIGKDLSERLFNRIVLDDIKEDGGKKVLVKAGTRVGSDEVMKLKGKNLSSARVRSLVSCKYVSGICATCYGRDLGRNKPVAMGTAVGIIAAQSIGEPGTQLTMRTFHTGGVVGQDITQGLPRVEELFEVRPPKKKSFIAYHAGKVKVVDGRATMQDPLKKTVPQSARRGKVIQITYEGMSEAFFQVTTGAKVAVKDGQAIQAETLLFTTKSGKATLSTVSGRVVIEKKAGTKGKDLIKVVATTEQIDEYEIPFGYVLWVKDGELVEAGQQLTEGSNDLNQLYQLKGQEAVQRYVINEILYIYSSQGQKLDEKHVELIVRQMFSRVLVEESGDTDLIAGEVIEYVELAEENARVKKNKGAPATGKPLLLGITKISLTTRSWLSAASFQETARVLINAAVTGKVDKLEGLKENVIIGRLIPVGTGFRDVNMVSKKLKKT